MISSHIQNHHHQSIPLLCTFPTNPRVPTIHHLSLLDWFTLGGCARSHCFPYGIGQFPVSNGTAIPNTIPACAVHCNFFHVHWCRNMCHLHGIHISPCIFIPSAQRSWRGLYWFHLVHLSVRLSVHLSVCGQNRVHSVFSTILAGSSSYLYILSSNFQMCVVCNIFFFQN